jgi:hypothetical protein
MGERSRRRIRDLVTRLAFEGLSENEIGCARISMMARSIRSTKGPDTEEQDQSLPLSRFSLQRTAGPYNWVMTCRSGSVERMSACTPKTAGPVATQLMMGSRPSPSCSIPAG